MEMTIEQLYDTRSFDSHRVSYHATNPLSPKKLLDRLIQSIVRYLVYGVGVLISDSCRSWLLGGPRHSYSHYPVLTLLPLLINVRFSCLGCREPLYCFSLSADSFRVYGSCFAALALFDHLGNLVP